MVAYAAIDVRGGRVVQLVGGRPEEERVSLPDPAAVARQWIDCGFRALHVVDLDAALGTGGNRAAIADVLNAAAGAGVTVQVGGGVRTTEAARALLEDTGVARVVVGTRAVEDRAWLAGISRRWPQRIVVAADVDGAAIVTRGWTSRADVTAPEFLAGLDALPLAGVLVTDVAREGSMRGADRSRFAQLVAATAHPLLASGGIANAGDLAALADAGVAGAVLGMALYTGALDARATARDYGG